MNFFPRSFFVFVYLIIFVSPLMSKENQNKNKNKNDISFKEKTLDNFINSEIDDQSVNKDQDKLLIGQVELEPDLLVEEAFELSNKSHDRYLEREVLLKANTAHFRIIDKIYGTSDEIEVFKYMELEYRSLRIGLRECFYDNKNLGNGSIALLKISDNSPSVKTYDGWMSSSFSHLNNYNNYRYSLWLLSCSISNQE